ncbi:MAG TPA: ribonuclease R [Chitinophagales bacterium]|nr:ribonuclease R [Chitinophagales bacterium]
MSKKKKKQNTRLVKAGRDFAAELYSFLIDKSAKGASLKVIFKWAGKTGQLDGVFDAIENLVSEGKIEEYAPDIFRAKQKTAAINTMIGIVDMTQSGSAYVIIDGHLYDVYVPSHKTNRAFNGDTVRVKITALGKKKKPDGEIVEILKRGKELFIGKVDINDKFAFGITDDRFNNYDFYIPNEEIKKHKIVSGDRVIMRIKDWPPTMKNPIAQIVSKLSQPGNHSSDMEAILVETGINYIFPKEVEQQAEELPTEITKAEIKRRRDMRDIFTITIDPYDAKDFDDAISYRKLENGFIEIGVHIADVSHYIIPDGPIDKEAYSRGTSVYLVDRVIPMLPEKLSNNVCSLRPHEEKLTFSAIFEMDEKGHIVNEWFGKTVIYSDRRFTYEEVQEIIESKSGEYVDEILAINKISTLLREKRFASGAISFETQEVKFILDENFVPTGLYVKERKEAHMLIEDLMLLANRRVAFHLSKNFTKVPFVYRVHDTPDIQKLEEFGENAKRFGHKLKLDSPKNISAELNRLMNDIKGKPEQNILESLAIRCMAKAVYTTKNIGHYGLAFEHYTHFTSPIRRYPDLMVHRILANVLDNHVLLYANREQLEDKCRHSSATERKAMEAERESVKYKQVEYMTKHVGESFDGVISGITSWGVFVEIVENKCEGMIHVDNIRDELMYDEARRRLVSLTNSTNYELGNKIRIKVQKADLATRKLEFIPDSIE